MEGPERSPRGSKALPQRPSPDTGVASQVESRGAPPRSADPPGPRSLRLSARAILVVLGQNRHVAPFVAHGLAPEASSMTGGKLMATNLGDLAQSIICGPGPSVHRGCAEKCGKARFRGRFRLIALGHTGHGGTRASIRRPLSPLLWAGGGARPARLTHVIF